MPEVEVAKPAPKWSFAAAVGRVANPALAQFDEIQVTGGQNGASDDIVRDGGLPRVALEYGRIFSASRTRRSTTMRSPPGMLMLKRALRK